MSGQNHNYIVDETLGSKVARKAKDAPFLIVGLAGLVGVCAVGAYKFKNKGSMPTSMFLMQLRVTAQGMVIGSLTIGLACQMINEYISTDKKK